jgi:hypothetical protein
VDCIDQDWQMTDPTSRQRGRPTEKDLNFEKKKISGQKSQIGLDWPSVVMWFRFWLLTESVLARSQHPEGPATGQLDQGFSVVFLGPRANAKLVPKFQDQLHASHAAPSPIVTLKISPCTNVALTFDFDFGLDHAVHEGYGWGSPTPRRRSNCQTKKLKYG